MNYNFNNKVTKKLLNITNWEGELSGDGRRRFNGRWDFGDVMKVKWEAWRVSREMIDKGATWRKQEIHLPKSFLKFNSILEKKEKIITQLNSNSDYSCFHVKLTNPTLGSIFSPILTLLVFLYFKEKQT